MSSPVRIIDLSSEDEAAVRAVAALLVRAGGFGNFDEAIRVVNESFAARSFGRVAVGEAGVMLGWYTAREQLVGRLWERRYAAIETAVEVGTFADVWRAFDDDLEEQARARGGATLESLRRVNDRPGEIFTRGQAARNLNEIISCLRRVTVG